VVKIQKNLCYFLHDDKELERIAIEYKSGKMMSGQIKKILATIICEFVENHKKVKNSLTKEQIDLFFKRNRKFDMTVEDKQDIILEKDYTNYGINFDIYFGLYK
jgi:hypothetical protein